MSHFFLPSSPVQVLALLREFPDAQLMAGGTDLLVRRRKAAPELRAPLIGLERVLAWQGVREDETGVSIGACTSFSRMLADPLLAARAPMLLAAARCIGGPAIRNMATLGGNVCTASPAGDSLPPLYVLNAQVELMSPEGCRRVALDQWVTGPGQTRLGPGEVVTQLWLPREPSPTHQHFEKVGQRQSMAIAVASFAGVLRLGPDQRVTEARFAWGSVGPTVMRVPALESFLLGRKLDAAVTRAAVEQVQRGVAPIDDVRASAAYRRALAANLLLRFLQPFYG